MIEVIVGEEAIRGEAMPGSLTGYRLALAEWRARGIECAADEARLRGFDELADELETRAAFNREAAVNVPASS